MKLSLPPSAFLCNPVLSALFCHRRKRSFPPICGRLSPLFLPPPKRGLSPAPQPRFGGSPVPIKTVLTCFPLVSQSKSPPLLFPPTPTLVPSLRAATRSGLYATVDRLSLLSLLSLLKFSASTSLGSFSFQQNWPLLSLPPPDIPLSESFHVGFDPRKLMDTTSPPPKCPL